MCAACAQEGFTQSLNISRHMSCLMWKYESAPDGSKTCQKSLCKATKESFGGCTKMRKWAKVVYLDDGQCKGNSTTMFRMQEGSNLDVKIKVTPLMREQWKRDVIRACGHALKFPNDEEYYVGIEYNLCREHFHYSCFHLPEYHGQDVNKMTPSQQEKLKKEGAMRFGALPMPANDDWNHRQTRKHARKRALETTEAGLINLATENESRVSTPHSRESRRTFAASMQAVQTTKKFEEEIESLTSKCSSLALEAKRAQRALRKAKFKEQEKEKHDRMSVEAHMADPRRSDMETCRNLTGLSSRAFLLLFLKLIFMTIKGEENLIVNCV